MRLIFLSMLMLVLTACDQSGDSSGSSEPAPAVKAGGEQAAPETDSAAEDLPVGRVPVVDAKDDTESGATDEAESGVTDDTTPEYSELERACVQVDGGWGCTHPGWECIRGWCGEPW